jgi:hypothetical protein
MHFLVILFLKTLWAGVKHWRTALHRFYVYRKPISSPRSRNLKVIKNCVHLKCILWFVVYETMMSGQLILDFALFTATHAFLISLSPFFFHDLLIIEVVSDYDWDIFFILVTLDLCLLLIYRDLWNSQKWQILISVNRDLDLFLFPEIRAQALVSFKKYMPPSSSVPVDSWPVTPPSLLKFSSIKGVQNRSKFTNIYFFNFHLYFLGGIRLSCLPLNCHYHQISFAQTPKAKAKQVVPTGARSYIFTSPGMC